MTLLSLIHGSQRKGNISGEGLNAETVRAGSPPMKSARRFWWTDTGLGGAVQSSLVALSLGKTAQIIDINGIF